MEKWDWTIIDQEWNPDMDEHMAEYKENHPDNEVERASVSMMIHGVTIQTVVTVDVTERFMFIGTGAFISPEDMGMMDCG